MRQKMSRAFLGRSMPLMTVDPGGAAAPAGGVSCAGQRMGPRQPSRLCRGTDHVANLDTPRLPAEWEPQAAVLMAWPHQNTDWQSSLAAVEPVFAAIAAAISKRARVILVAPDTQRPRRCLAAAGANLSRVHLYPLPTNDTWMRDCGPLTVLTARGPVLRDFVFNGWGLKAPAGLDNVLTRRLHAAGAFGPARLSSEPLVLEGGSIESDGRGTLLTTRRCLLNPNRNPGLSYRDIERRLRLSLGIRRVLWLEHGQLAGDDTDAHVDTLVRLAPGSGLVYVACRDRTDSHHAGLHALERELHQLRTIAGQPFRLFPLPWPAARYDAAGARLPATYANFLVINGAVLVPTYRDPCDAAAMAVVSRAFPGYEVQGIDCLPLIAQHGSLHCLTMQLPAAVADGAAQP